MGSVGCRQQLFSECRISSELFMTWIVVISASTCFNSDMRKIWCINKKKVLVMMSFFSIILQSRYKKKISIWNYSLEPPHDSFYICHQFLVVFFSFLLPLTSQHESINFISFFSNFHFLFVWFIQEKKSSEHENGKLT